MVGLMFCWWWWVFGKTFVSVVSGDTTIGTEWQSEGDRLCTDFRQDDVGGCVILLH